MLTGGSVVIRGGTFTRLYSSNYDIEDRDGTGNITLTVGEKGEGPTFALGLRVKGTTLEEILDEGMAYWQEGKQVTLTEGQTEIPEGAVTVRVACPHTESTTCDDNGDGTHSDICTACGTVLKTEPHSMTEVGCQSIAPCTVCFAMGRYGDHSFNEESICEVCGKVYTPAELYSHSISLTGNIAINYYMILSDAVVADPTAYMQFTMAEGQVRKVTVAESDRKLYNGVVYFIFTCEVGAKEMTDTVTAQFFYEGGATEIDTYSVKTYADHILGSSTDEELIALVTAMLRYGAASQLQFNHNIGNLADTGLEPVDYSQVDIDVPEFYRPEGTERVKYEGATLILNSQTTLRFYFSTSVPVEELRVTYEGEILPIRTSNQLFYVDIEDISAQHLDERFVISLNDGEFTVGIAYSPLYYCASVNENLSGYHSETLQNVVTALYLYNQAANRYFEKA